MAAPWHVQMQATLLRNWRIKTRDGGRTLQEIFLPMYILLLLVFMKVVQPVLNLPALPSQPITDAVCNSLDGSGSACWELADRSYEETVLGFVPPGPAIQTVVQGAANFLEATYPGLPTLTVRGYASEAELVTAYNQNAGTIYAGLVFNVPDQAPALPSDIEYTIRINGSYLPSSNDNDSPVDKSSCRVPDEGSYQFPTACPTQRYLTSGLLALEGAVAHALAAAELPESCGAVGGGLGHMHAQQRPLPPYDKGFASVRFRLFAAMYLVWALAPVLQSVASEIVHEKDALIKDCLLQMGLIESVYWLAWLLTFAVTAAITAAVVVAIAWATALFEASSVALVFLLVYLFLLSLVALGLALSAVFTKARSASAAGFLLMVLGSLAIFPIDLLNLPSGVCGVLALFSPVAFVLAIDTTVIAEGSGDGIRGGSLFSRTVGNDPGDPMHPLSVGGALCLIVADTILYLLLAWYLDNVWPHPGRGAKRPWSFVLDRAYWSPPPEGYQRLGSRRNTEGVVVELEQLDGDEGEDDASRSDLQIAVREDNPDDEPVEPSLAAKVAIVFSNLRKVHPPRRHGLIGRSVALLTSWWPFGRGRGRGGGYQRQRDSAKRTSKPTVAVKGLTMKLYEGQVFAFLGHTRSGKSSVAGMLMGLVRPTSGEAYVYSHRVTQAGPALHSGSLLGVCPQSNIHSGFLTAAEQLVYVATIKGENSSLSHTAPGPDGAAASAPNVDQTVQSLLAELGMAANADELARTLNESARRKLTIALALVGDPHVVVLDEPTRGLDAVSRSQVWEALLQRRAGGQCVVITTDSMEEADLLADRKAILSHGVLKCCGSSLFLKNKFGLSYLLHVTKTDNFDAPAVLGLIQSSLPEAIPVPGTRGDHATYRLPLGRSSEVAAMMMELTERAEQVGVAGGALESTTLEEIFMQFAGEAEEEAAALPPLLESAPHRAPPDEDDTTHESLLHNSADQDGTPGADDRIDLGFDADAAGKRATFRQQFVAVVKMRVKTYRRSPGLLFNTLGMALIFTLVAILVQVAYKDTAEEPVHLVNPAYGNDVPIFYSPPAGAQNASQVATVLRKFGPNVQQYDSAALAAALSSAASGTSPDFVAVSFDAMDLRGCSAQYTVLYQPWQIHQLPTIASMLDAAILETMNDLASGAVTTLSVWSKALPYLDAEYIFGYFVGAFVCLSTLMIPPQLGGQVVSECETGLRPLLRVAGLRSFPFWLGTWLGDALFMAITYQLISLLGSFFGRTPFLKPAMLVLFVLNVLAPKAQLLMVYVWTFGMRNGLAAASNLSVLFFAAAVVPYFFMLTLWVDGTSSIVPFHTIMSFLNPPYALLAGYHFINYTNARLTGKNGEGPPASVSAGAYFQWDTQIPVTLLGLTTAGALYALRLWHLEVKATEPETRQEAPAELSNAAAEPPLEPEVAAEKQKVVQKGAAWGTLAQSDTTAQEQDDALILCYGLGKTYPPVVEDTEMAPPVVALHNFWLSVGAGETIVLVGPAAAGKSTLLGCLAGTMEVTHGDALICGQSVRYSYEFGNGGKVGFCPQGDVVAGAMTVREHLQMLCSMRGLAASGALAVDSALLSAEISAEQAKQLARNAPPGTLRKLQLAMALLGGPRVLLLDEPTFGMDAAGRQAVWSQIKAGSAGRATLICTSSVEEAEALGTQVGVLVKGRLRCLGSPQSIKKKYGSDYSLIVRAHPSKLPAIRTFINTLFPSPSSSSGNESGGAHSFASESDLGGQARFGVPIQTLPELAMLLHELETKRSSLGIEDYSVSQPTLQQAFFRLSKEEAGQQAG